MTQNDPFELLKADHDKVKGLFSQFEKAKDDEKKKQLFEQMKLELTAHTRAEEKALYPPLEGNSQTADLTVESIEEHKVIERLLNDASKLDPSDEHWEAKITVMMENVEHHVKEEEEKMFPKAQKVLSKEEQASIAKQLAEIEKQVKA